VSDLVGTTIVLLLVAVFVGMAGVLSIVTRGPLNPLEARSRAIGPTTPAAIDLVAVMIASEVDAEERRAREKADIAHDSGAGGTETAAGGPPADRDGSETGAGPG
jgi:hypothetical protein